jgi:hypothetical protein
MLIKFFLDLLSYKQHNRISSVKTAFTGIPVDGWQTKHVGVFE